MRLLAILLAVSLRAAEKSAPEIPRLGAVNAPLTSNAVVLPQNLGTANLEIPALPDSSQIPQARPAESVLSAAPSAAVAAAKTPYFVEGLGKLGAPRELALELAAVQQAIKPRPGEDAQAAQVRRREAADLMSKAVEGRAGYTLTRPQKAMLVVAAALRGADLDQAQTAAVLKKLAEALKFDAGQAAAMTLAAIAADATSDRDFREQAFQKAVASAFGAQGRAWAEEWGRSVTYLEKAALFSSGLAKLQDYPFETTLLFRSQNYQILPLSVQTTIKTAQALHASGKGRAPPAGAQKALETAGREAQSLGVETGSKGVVASVVDAARRALGALATRGWAVLAPGSVISREDTDYLLAAADANWPENKDSVFKTWELYDGRDWRVNNVQTEEVVELARDMSERLEALVREATPGEDVKLVTAEIRLGNERQSGIHLDGSYITVTLTLRGPGTLVFDDSGPGIQIVRGKVGEAVAITNKDREYLMDVAASVHASPPPTDPRRVVYIARFAAARTKDVPKDFKPDKRLLDLRTREKDRLKRVGAFVHSREPNAEQKANLEKRGFSGIWSKLFE